MKNQTDTSIPSANSSDSANNNFSEINSWQHEISERAQTLEQTVQKIITDNPLEAVVVVLGVGLAVSTIFGALKAKSAPKDEENGVFKNITQAAASTKNGLHS